MLVKLLGLLDLCAVACLSYGWLLPKEMIMTVSMILCMKGILFASMMNMISVLDAVAGVYIPLLIVYGFGHKIITWFLVLYLLQKGLLSIFAR